MRDTIYCFTTGSRRKHIEILLHEALHVAQPSMSEDKVQRLAKDLTRLLYLSGELK